MTSVNIGVIKANMFEPDCEEDFEQLQPKTESCFPSVISSAVPFCFFLLVGSVVIFL